MGKVKNLEFDKLKAMFESTLTMMDLFEEILTIYTTMVMQYQQSFKAGNTFNLYINNLPSANSASSDTAYQQINGSEVSSLYNYIQKVQAALGLTNVLSNFIYKVANRNEELDAVFAQYIRPKIVDAYKREYEKFEQEMKMQNPSFSWDDVPEDVKNTITTSVNEAIENDIKQANMYNPPPVENHE